MRASGNQNGSHREPERNRERASKSQRETQREPVRARGNQSELETTRKSHSEPERVKESSQAAIMRGRFFLCLDTLKYVFLSKIVKMCVKS